MNFSPIFPARVFATGLALLCLPLGFSQIPESELDSIFARLNGSDYDAVYDARIELQNHVATAIAPGNESEQSLVTAQLLERLRSESLLTTQLWILRQLEYVASASAIPELEPLLDSPSKHLAEAARMTISAIATPSKQKQDRKADDSPEELVAHSKNGENRSIQFAAFKTLSAQNPKLAMKVFKAELSKEDSSVFPEFLRIAIESDHRNLRNLALAELGGSEVAKQIVVLGGLRSKASPKLEKQLVGLLDTDNLTLQIQALETLGRVGSALSLDAVLALIDAKPRELSDAASDALAAIKDKRIDQKLFKAANKGSVADQVLALKALSYRATEGIGSFVNDRVADSKLDNAIREEAIAAMVSVGNLESLPILVKVVTDDPELRKDAQLALKRITLRLDDEVAAWNAFSGGLETADPAAKVALLQVIDSAPTQEAIDLLLAEWERGDPATRKIVMRILPQWRNWDGGFALLKIQETAPDDPKLSSQCFKGISRLILGSDATFPLPEKYQLVEQAFAAIKNPADKQSIINGFKNCDWKDGVYIKQIEIDDELRATIEGIVGF